MLHYELAGTALLRSDVPPPTESEMYVFTVALMLEKDCSYSSLEDSELRLESASVEAVANRIERQLSIFTRDVGHGERLRSRLSEFVGMRIANFTPRNHAACRGAT